LRFNNGAVDDDDDDDEEVEEEESDEEVVVEEEEEEGGEGEGGAAGETEGKGSCGEKERQSSPRSCGSSPSPGEEVSEDEYVQVGGVLERRKRKATVTPGKLQISKIETPHKLQISEVQTPHKLQISEVETPHQLQISEVEIKSKEVQALVLAQDSQRISQENENLRLQLALKTKELEHEENQKLRLQLELKNKDIESLKKQNDELKAEIEYYKKTTKPPRVARRCRWCEEYTTHDYRNCPQRRSY
ncbi:centromere-binding protein 1, partial [Oryza sativa Japonica Group]|uniref:centromere-binding protein 1 n=1 Tax=Oryza sativa subsp. japonica TaxID=39947 RepID=UPI00077540D5